MKKCKFDIFGMTCSSCQSHVQNAVKKLDGAKDVNVNLLSNSMSVEFDERLLNEEQIIRAVVDAGYGATISSRMKSNSSNQKSENTENEIGFMKKRLIISFCFLIPLMYISMHHMFYEWLGIPVPAIITKVFHGNENVMTSALTQFLLLIPIVYVNRNYFIVGFKRLLRGSPNMDSLIAIGSSASIIYSIFSMFMIGYGLGHGNLELTNKHAMDIYFESAGTILTLITFGKYLEAKSKGKTSDAITKLIHLAPQTALVIREGKEVEIATQDIAKNDTLVIKPGGSVPVDGVIIEGKATFDESSITGESVPVEKNVGDCVISGTISKNGAIKMKATKVGEDTTLSQIIKLVEEAGNSKAPISKIADRVSFVFVPIVIGIALLTLIIWLMIGEEFDFALTMAVAVLVISCPCALGLATPVAIMVSMGKGAEKGILIKTAESLEMLHDIDTVVLDKTGTITEGKPRVTDIMSAIDLEEFLKIAGTLEKNSEHPFAKAIIERVDEDGLKLYEVQNFEAVLGRGVKGIIDGCLYFGGNIAFMNENKIEIKEANETIEELQNQGKTILYFATNKEMIGIIAIADTIKSTSYQAIETLKKEKIDVVMLTGDNQVVAENIGNELGIENIVAEVMPADKEKEVAKIQEEGKRVAFVGDGINDSPAMVRADVGIAIGSGTDIAIESADIVLMKDNLQDAVTAIELSKVTMNNIKINLFWAFFYNCIGIPLAAGLFYHAFGIKLNPMIGALAMSFSSVCVVTNALRLRFFQSSFEKKSFNVNRTDVPVNFNSEKEEKEKEEKEMIFEKKIMIEGMHCNHCKMTVEKALSSIDGVKSVEVSLEEKNAIVIAEREITEIEIKEVIENAGFVVKEIL